jgi:hypothetical protein
VVNLDYEDVLTADELKAEEAREKEEQTNGL